MVDYTRYKNIKVEKTDRVATVTMNRPDVLNAVSFDLHRELVHVFDDLAWDNDIWVVILTGAGRAFSAGGDIKWFKRFREDPEHNPMPPIEEAVNMIRNIVELPKPVIAAVNGPTMGLGASLAFACDIVIVAEDARFADTHVTVGVSAGDGGCLLWPLMMGMAKAKEHLFTGEPLNPRDAERMGIINKVVPADQVMPEAISFAQRLTAIAPMAIKHTKMAINREVSRRLHDILPTSVALENLCFATDDHIEAVSAFIEKGKPIFTGR